MSNTYGMAVTTKRDIPVEPPAAGIPPVAIRDAHWMVEKLKMRPNDVRSILRERYQGVQAFYYSTFSVIDLSENYRRDKSAPKLPGNKEQEMQLCHMLFGFRMAEGPLKDQLKTSNNNIKEVQQVHRSNPAGF